MNNDEYFMKEAIKEAKKSLFPFGAILVKDNIVVARAGSGDELGFDPTGHSEIKVIRKFCNELQTKQLKGVTLYSTCEPCPMCFGACWWAEIDKLVFGITLKQSAKIFGEEIQVSSHYLNEKGNNKLKIVEGILKEEILKMMQNNN